MNVGFFKNKVGRPSNDTLKKRRILILLSILIVLILVGGGLYFYKQHFNSNNIAGINKNATTTAKKAVITAKKADGSNYTSNTWATTVKLTASLKGKVPGTIKYTWYKNKKI